METSQQGSSLASGGWNLTSSKKAVFAVCVDSLNDSVLCGRRLGTSSFCLIRSPTGQSHLDYSRKRLVVAGEDAYGFIEGLSVPLLPSYHLSGSLIAPTMMCFFVDYSGNISKTRKGNMRLVLHL